MAKKQKEEAADAAQATVSVITPIKKTTIKKPGKKTVKPQKPTVSPPLDPSKPVETEGAEEEVLTPTLLDESTKEMLTRTHTPKPPSETKLEFGDEMKKIILTGGTLELTKEQNKVLFADFQDTDVSMKPDGLIYLPWIKYSARLTQTFGGTGWVLIPEGMPKENNNVIYWGFHLVIKGVYCGFSIGEQQYFNNNRMTYGEACEGAKSNALTRLCKGLGIGIKLWDKGFIEGWLNKYAVFNWEEDQKTGKRKKVYKLKTTAPDNTNTNGHHQFPKRTEEGQQKTATVTSNPQPHKKNTPVVNKEETDQEKIPLVKQYEKKLREATSMVVLQSEYHQVKLAWNNGSGTITKEEKEYLRILANDLASKFDQG